jgi:hypothetical protein
MATFTLRRVRLNGGGYDDSGTYWGVGAPLYEYSYDDAESGDVTVDYIRAVSRDHVKDIIRRKYPDAKFYR